VIAQGYETIGEVVMLKEILEGGDRRGRQLSHRSATPPTHRAGLHGQGS
jgi:hypothetical protein